MSDIDQAKKVSIPEYLFSLGFLPVEKQNGELVYLSPLRIERTPSFFVHLQKNVFKDFGTEEHKGDVIRLCQLLERCSFPTAIAKLNTWSGSGLPESSFSFSGLTSKSSDRSTLQVTAVKSLQHPALIRYVESRGIPQEIACEYVKQVHYQKEDKHYFAIGFPNDQGGYALRNGAGFKGQTSPAGITRLIKPGSKAICVFEGFFDFLSALVYYQKGTPSHTTIILNSTAHLSRAIHSLKEYQQLSVYCFLDRDVAGIQAMEKLRKFGFQVKDCSILYENHKDFNEFLVKKGQKW